MSRIRRIISEIHRRSLWQVLGIYVGGSWVALEVADQLVDNFGLPTWFPAFALALLVLGLPVVLATAFVQEGPPRPAAREDAAEVAHHAAAPAREAATTDEPRAQALLTWRNALLGGVAAFALWGIVATIWLLRAGSAGAVGSAEERPSIAVLPFDNLSSDAENAYFADGIHEEIVARLAGIDALRVISRTSVMEYRDSDKNVREIARELGVESILEGSVRRAGNQVRITAQLIDAETDEHIWAQSYNRALSDIFAIQADVAEQIASALHAELGAEERSELADRPTDDLAAYDDYLRAREMEARGRRPDLLAASQRLYERAIERDPSFVDARARLAWSHLLTYWLGFDRSPARVERARTQVAWLREHAPDAPETHFAMGYHLYYAEYDFAGAAEEFERAVEEIPDVRAGLAYVQRRMGQWDEHIRNLEIARESSPRDQDFPRNLGETYSVLGRYDDAVRTYREAIELSPTSPDAYAGLAFTHMRVGRPELAEQILDEAAALDLDDPLLVIARIEAAMTHGDHRAALAACDAARDSILISQLEFLPVALLRAEAHTAAGDREAAANAYAEAQRVLERAAAERPWDPRVWLALAHTRSGLGQRDAAHDAMTRVRELYPVERDKLLGPEIKLEFARVHARLGEADEAIALLRENFAAPTGYTIDMLRTDPVWRPLRGDPRFARLIRS